jgi:hypothetical protein
MMAVINTDTWKKAGMFRREAGLNELKSYSTDVLQHMRNSERKRK